MKGLLSFCFCEKQRWGANPYRPSFATAKGTYLYREKYLCPYIKNQLEEDYAAERISTKEFLGLKFGEEKPYSMQLDTN